jgi:hypothetical protein
VKLRPRIQDVAFERFDGSSQSVVVVANDGDLVATKARD